MRIVVAALAACLLGIGLLMVPGESEYASMLYRDHLSNPARALAERRFAEGDRSPGLLDDLYLLRMEAGDAGEATQTIEALAAVSGGDPATKRRLAEHYLANLDVDGFIAVLEDAPLQELDDRLVGTLLGELRYSGAFDEEITVLRRLSEIGPLSQERTARFGMLLASHGDVTQAIAVLSNFDDRAAGPARTERETLFQLLLDAGAYAEAFTRAQRWINAWADTDARDDLARQFDEAGQFELARQFAALPIGG